MNARFIIEDWAACAPGLQDKAAWRLWSQTPRAPLGDEVPALTEMPAMQRRRLERVGRMALQAAYWCQSADAVDIPIVFASRHGDIQRTYEMLEVLAKGEALSPTNFGLSIHNAIVAQYSIARQIKQNYLAVSAGKTTAEAAMIEALGLLNDGAEQVLVVMYDGLVPEAYRGHMDESIVEYAWAWRVRRASSQEAGFSLSSLATGLGSPEKNSDLPHGLNVLRFMLSDEKNLSVSDDARHWLWQRHAESY